VLENTSKFVWIICKKPSNIRKSLNISQLKFYSVHHLQEAIKHKKITQYFITEILVSTSLHKIQLSLPRPKLQTDKQLASSGNAVSPATTSRQSAQPLVENRPNVQDKFEF
jgi:hypothetical protein